MGGYSSGRHRTRNRGTVGECCRIDLRLLKRMGALKEGQRWSGTLSWDRRGERVGSMGFTADLGGEERKLVLSYAYRGEPRTVTVRLEAEPMRFGGFRYYARCPLTGRRCIVLPVVGGVVACRQAHRLVYASQSEDWLGRLRSRSERLEKRFDAKRRRGANRERLMQAWIDAEVAFEEAMAAEAMRRFGSLFVM